MTKDILEINIKKNIKCSKEVALWNYWDHEHLDVIHGGYTKSDILYDRENYLFRIDLIKIPFVPLMKFTTPIFMVQHDNDTLLVFATQFGVLSKTTITIKSLENTKCEITMNYKFYLNGWRGLLRPLLKKLIPIWNEKVWREDYPVKIRRQKILDMNFKDFVGLPEKITDRINNSKKEFKLPIPRPKNSTRDQHPLRKVN
jgi:hypothetical protein